MPSDAASPASDRSCASFVYSVCKPGHDFETQLDLYSGQDMEH